MKVFLLISLVTLVSCGKSDDKRVIVDQRKYNISCKYDVCYGDGLTCKRESRDSWSCETVAVLEIEKED